MLLEAQQLTTIGENRDKFNLLIVLSNAMETLQLTPKSTLYKLLVEF